MKIKMLWLMLCIVLLTACSEEENIAVSSWMPATTKEPVEEASVTPSVIVYGISSVTNGFVIHTEERKKWLVTIASAVSEHPNALIETSEGQILKAEVVAIDETNNIAILTFKNSATMLPFPLQLDAGTEQVGEVGVIELSDDKAITSFTSLVMTKEKQQPYVVQPQLIQNLLDKAIDESLEWQERFEVSQSFAGYPAIGTDLVNKIDSYDKNIFDYNPDALLTHITQFQENLNTYMETKDTSKLENDIASDDLLEQLQETDGGFAVGELDIQSINVVENIYIVEAKTTLASSEEEQEVRVIYKSIKQQGKWQVISIYVD